MPEIKITYVDEPSKLKEVQKWKRIRKFLIFVHWMTIAGWIGLSRMSSNYSPYFAIAYMFLSLPKNLFLEPKVFYIHLCVMVFTLVIFIIITIITTVQIFVDFPLPKFYTITSEYKFMDRWCIELSFFYIITSILLIPYILGVYYYVKTKLRKEIPENRVEIVKF